MESNRKIEQTLWSIPAFAALCTALTWFGGFLTVRASVDNYAQYSFTLGHAGFILSAWGRIAGALAAAALLRELWLLASHRIQKRHPGAAQSRTAFILGWTLKGAYLLVMLYELYRFGLTSMRYFLQMTSHGYFSGQPFPYGGALVCALCGACALSAAGCLLPWGRRLGGFWRTVRMLLGMVGAVCGAAVLNALVQLIFGRDINAVSEWLLMLVSLASAVRVLSLLWADARAGRAEAMLACPALPRLRIRQRPRAERPARERREGESLLQRRTGLSFKSLWTIRFTLSLIPYAVLGIVLLLVLSTMVYTIEPYQEVLLYHFGTLQQSSVKEPGLHTKLPWPLDQIEVYDVDRVRSLQVGYLPSGSKDYLWTSAHGGEEYALLLGNGNELVAVNMRLSYSISGLIDYATRHQNPEGLLTSRTYELMMRRTMSSDLTTMLSIDRESLSRELCQELQDYADEMRLGIRVGEVIVENIHPPVDVATVYQNVINASIRKSAAVIAAEAEAVQKLNEAEQKRQSAVIRAEYTQVKKTSQAHADMAVYGAAFEAYPVSPECYTLLRTLEAYEKVIAREKLYVFSEETGDDMSPYWISNGLPVLVK